MAEIIAGIDLGTTNSEIAVVQQGKVRVIALEGEQIMPSVVGIDPDGKLIVGTKAKNQLAAYPERTVRSIKRSMGTDRKVALGDQQYTPPEISAFILKELVRRAELELGTRITKVVITVPAFFQDAQRQATKLAGTIAGLEVVRIVNEPTAAALAFEDQERERNLLVYDLGGGTFDVSLVKSGRDVTEVLASHGDVHLGGDDFDVLLLDRLAERFVAAGRPDPRTDRILRGRLLHAAEQAKIRLTEEVCARVREEFLGTDAHGAPVHLDLEVGREEFETLIGHLIEKSLSSVHEALASAHHTIADIDDILLVGGATRMPIVSERLQALTRLRPRCDVHPDLCVAMGAAILGARLSGESVGRVLVDVTPYSFGPEHAEVQDGELVVDCYTPLIARNTPLPVTRSHTYYTMVGGQESWEVRVFQGESARASQNIEVGRFIASGFARVPAGNEVVCKMKLDLDGILTVDVIERRTGLAKQVTIERAMATPDARSINAARQRVLEQWAELDGEPAGELCEAQASAPLAVGDAALPVRAAQLLERAQHLRTKMASEDQTELERLERDLRAALATSDEAEAEAILDQIADLVYYVEGV